MAPLNLFSRRLWALWVLSAVWVQAIAVLAQASEPLPLDPAVKRGQLANGFTYFVRTNGYPEDRALFRLVVNVGSTSETEEELGLAHFLEHMAFNGTRNFEKQEIVDFMERIGMRFGPDLNAYTSFEETVYFLEVPTDKAEFVETAFRVLEDWAHQISFEAEEIEKERGVVLEEERSRRGAQARAQEKHLKVLFRGSRYADRLPIGEPEIIKTVSKAEFERFYRRYYRPNLMALVAVGDFEPDRIEQLIIKHFGHLKNPEEAPALPDTSVPGHQETLFSIVTDPEMQGSMVQIAYKREPERVKTVDDFRLSILEQLYSSMLNRRLDERGRQTNPPYLNAGMGKGSAVRGQDLVYQAAAVKEGEFAPGLKALLVEARRCRLFGFTEAELGRAKISLLRSRETAEAEKDKTDSSRYARNLTTHFLEGEAFPSVEFELELTRKLLPGVRLEEVDQVAANWITSNNRVIVFNAPEKDGLEPPAGEDILAVVDEAEKVEVQPYEEDDLSSPLLTYVPEPGRIIKENQHPRLGLTEWRLSNGVQIWLKPTDFKNDEVRMSAFSPGGHSLVPDEGYLSASAAGMLITLSGLGEFDNISLGKKLAGQRASVMARINSLDEELTGRASPRDLETFFQLMHLRFTQPRTDPKYFATYRARRASTLQNRLNDPQSVFSDAVEQALYGDHPRHLPPKLEDLEAVDLDEAYDIYRDRFADASDFEFVFVGAFQLDEMRPLVERYLGSLPDADREESWRDVGDTVKEGQLKVVVHKGLEQKSSVRLHFHGPAQWSPEEQYLLGSLIDVLRIRLREELREDKGGVYGVQAGGGMSRHPRQEFSTSISFTCDPERVEDLVATAQAVLDEVKNEGPKESDIKKVKEMQLRGRQEAEKENGFWLSGLVFHARFDLDPHRILDFPNLVEGLTAEEIKAAAHKYFDPANSLTAILYPEKSESRVE